MVNCIRYKRMHSGNNALFPIVFSTLRLSAISLDDCARRLREGSILGLVINHLGILSPFSLVTTVYDGTKIRWSDKFVNELKKLILTNSKKIVNAQKYISMYILLRGVVSSRSLRIYFIITCKICVQ